MRSRFPWLLINLATVRDVERIVGAPVDPLRFRANLYFEGAEAWAERLAAALRGVLAEPAAFAPLDP